MTKDEILDHLHLQIDGGCTKGWYEIFEELLEEGRDVREDDFTNVFDDHYFECNACGWTLPIGDMADNDEWECESCADD